MFEKWLLNLCTAISALWYVFLNSFKNWFEFIMTFVLHVGMGPLSGELIMIIRDNSKQHFSGVIVASKMESPFLWKEY